MPYGQFIDKYRCNDILDDGSEVQTNKIFVGDIGFGTPEQVIRKYFSKFGTVEHCTVKRERAKAHGFIHFSDVSGVEAVWNAGTTMHSVDGRFLEIRKALLKSEAPGTLEVSSDRHPRRDRSPKSMREEFVRAAMARRAKQQKKKGKKKKKARSSSSSSSGSKRRSRSRGQKAPSQKGRRTSRSISCNSTSSSVRITAGGGAAAAAAALAREPASQDPEVEKAKSDMLQRLKSLRSQPREQRLNEWRGLLREWHPDKNPERVVVATAVFQFLQKGKAMIE